MALTGRPASRIVHGYEPYQMHDPFERCSGSGGRVRGRGRSPWQAADLGTRDSVRAFEAAEAVLKQHFEVAESKWTSGTLSTRPQTFQRKREGTLADIRGAGGRWQRTVYFELENSGSTVVGRCAVQLEREATEAAIAVARSGGYEPHAADVPSSRPFGDRPVRKRGDQVWVDVGYDAGLARRSWPRSPSASASWKRARRRRRSRRPSRTPTSPGRSAPSRVFRSALRPEPSRRPHAPIVQRPRMPGPQPGDRAFESPWGLYIYLRVFGRKRASAARPRRSRGSSRRGPSAPSRWKNGCQNLTLKVAWRTCAFRIPAQFRKGIVLVADVEGSPPGEVEAGAGRPTGVAAVVHADARSGK